MQFKSDANCDLRAAIKFRNADRKIRAEGKYDGVEGTAQGRLRILVVVDDCMRECLIADTSISGKRPSHQRFGWSRAILPTNRLR